MEEQFLSPVEVAEILQVKKNTVYEMIKRGDLRATKMGKQFRIAQKDVYEYMGVTPPAVESPSNIVICGQDILLDALCAMFNAEKSESPRRTVLLWEATTDFMRCIRMKTMSQPVICGTLRVIHTICPM